MEPERAEPIPVPLGYAPRTTKNERMRRRVTIVLGLLQACVCGSLLVSLLSVCLSDPWAGTFWPDSRSLGSFLFYVGLVSAVASPLMLVGAAALRHRPLFLLGVLESSLACMWAGRVGVLLGLL